MAGQVVPPVPGPNPGVFPPKLARNADLEIQVRRNTFERQWGRVLDTIARFGGAVTSSSTDETRGRVASGNLSARIPADRLDPALAALRRLGSMRHLTISAGDVSGQLADYDARLRAARAEEDQLLALLRQARGVSETIEIRNRLSDVRSQIEQLQSQRDGLQSQVDYATVQLALHEPGAEPQPVGPPTRLDQAWVRGRDAAVTTVAGILVVLGFAAPLALLVLMAWGLRRLARRRRP
jgi:hypothetical protein